ncbi:MAG: FIST C-terminal domain-containing protein [Deltaproteobacteria bacterium]|nr:FIST C-terminal domain-containing protein [Deltaproteobacteria bacterium]
MKQIEVGYGAAEGKDSFSVGAEAALKAAEGITSHPLSAVLVFASVRYHLPELLGGIHHIMGHVPVFGATTAGEICNGSLHGSVVVTALASANLRVRLGLGKHVSAGWRKAVEQAIGSTEIRPYFSGNDSEIWAEMTRKGKSIFGILFSPGNTRHADSRSFETLEELKRLSAGRIPFFGGSAADDWNMEANFVLHNIEAHADSLLVAVFETSLRFGMSMGHGFSPSDKRAVATKVKGHTILELDGCRAADLYAKMLESDVDGLRDKHLTLTSSRPVGMPDMLDQYHINVASFFTPEGGVRFSQPVPENSTITIMEARPEQLIEAARETVRNALLRGQIQRPAVALVFSCALRRHILRERSSEEISAIRSLLPEIPILGFYSFGEQGVNDAGVSGHGNEKITALVLGDELSTGAEVALENQRLLRLQREAEKKLRFQANILDAVQDTVLIISSEMKTLWGNPVAKDLFGDRPEMFTDPCYRFYKQRDVICEECPVIKTMTDGRSHQAIMKSIDKDGNVIWRLNRAYPYFDEQGRIAGAIEIVSDYSDQKRLEDALKESELNLKQAQAVAGVGSWHLDIMHDVLTGSDEAYRIFGIPNRTPLNIETVLERVHPDDRTLVESAWNAALKGAVFDIEHRIISRQEELWVHEKARIVFDGRGTAIEAIGTVHNITKRKQTEESLREREEKFRFISENIADIVWTLDLNLNTTYVSPSVEAILGFTPEERVRQSLEEMITPESIQRILARFQEELLRENEDAVPQGWVCYMDGKHREADKGFIRISRRDIGRFA